MNVSFPVIPDPHSNLYAVANLVSAADKLPYFTGPGTADLTDFTSIARTLLAATTQTAQRNAIGLGVSDSPTFTTVTANLVGNVTGNVSGSSGSTTGNAATATILQTSRNIGGSPFNGSADVTSFPSPGAIGGTTPAAGTFTTMHATGNVVIDGDLLVSGDNFDVDVTTLVVEDPLIKLAKGNAADTVDIGLYGQYTSSGVKYAGAFRDATDGKWKIFTGLQTEPTTTVNIAGTGYTVGTLVGNLEGNVTGTASGNALTGAVTGSGLTMATARLLGRTTASSGAIEEITVGSGLTLSAGTLSATGGGGSGTVTNTGGNLTANAVVLGAGTVDVKVSTTIITDGTSRLGLGHTAFLDIGGNADQFNVVGTTAATGGMSLAMFNATAGTGAHLDFYRSKNAAAGSATVVASGDNLGSINWYGAQQTGTFATQSLAAQIRCEVNSAVTSGASIDMPGRIVFAVTEDASGAPPVDKVILEESFFKPALSGGTNLGKSGTPWANLFLNTTGQIDFGGGSAVITGATGVVSVTTGDLRVTTPGTNAASVPTLSSSPTWTGVHTHSPAFRTSGAAAYFRVNAPLDTGLTASTEAIGVLFSHGVARQHATGALATQREYVFQAPTYSFVGASTVTTTATVAVDDAPQLGTNATFTTPIALWVKNSTPSSRGIVVQTSNASGTTAAGVDVNITSTATFNTGFNVNMSGVGGANYGFRVTNLSGATENVGVLIGKPDVGAGNYAIRVTASSISEFAADVRVLTAGTNTASVLTLDGTQTSANKTFTSPVLNSPEIGHATDTTMARTASGKIAIEGKAVPLMSSTFDAVFAGPTAARTYTFPDVDSTVIAMLTGALSDGQYCGYAEPGTAGATLIFGDVVYFSAADSRWELCDANATTTAGDVDIGICVLAAAGDGSATTILRWGRVRADAAFPSFSPLGGPVYLSETAGDLTSTAPTTTDVNVRRVAWAKTADELWFWPSNDYHTHT